jgi:hypothetical protein
MLTIVVLLTYALLPTGLDNWPVQSEILWEPGMAAKCFLPEIGHYGISADVILPVLFLWVNLFTRAVRIFDWSAHLATNIFKDAMPIISVKCLLTKSWRTTAGLNSEQTPPIMRSTTKANSTVVTLTVLSAT